MLTDLFEKTPLSKRLFGQKIRVGLFILPILLGSLLCPAATVTWNGSVSSDWFVAGNWTPSGVPTSSDTINFTNGTIDLTAPVSIGGTFNWSAGTLSGDAMTVKSGGLLNINGNVALENVLTNAGTVTMTGAGAITVYNDGGPYFGGFYNLAGALWDIQTNANIGGVYGHEFFDNAGNFRRSLGTSTAIVGINFTNSGTVTNLAASLYFNAGGALTGTYDTAAGAATYFASGNFSIGALPVITGAGICEFLGTTLTLAQSVPPNLLLAGGNVLLGSGFQNFGAITNLTISGATLPGTNSITGTMDWAAGVISGPMTVKSGGLLNINGNVALENVLTNAGTVTMTGAGAITVYNDGGPYFGGIYNLAGALWDIQTNANMGAVYGHEFFDNAGNFRRSLGTSTAIVGINFTNSGTVTNLAASLYFNAGGALTGTYDTAAGAATYFASGNFSIGALPVITGAGICEFLGTTLTLAQSVPPNLLLAGGNVLLGSGFQNFGAITNLTISGATLPGTNSITGTMDWAAGVISGPMTVKSGGLLNINGNVALENVLTNAGTVTMTGAGAITVYNDGGPYFGGFYNLAGALWDIQTNANIGGVYGHEFFDNAGNFRRSLGTSTAIVGINFTNSGTVTNLAASLYFNAGGALTGTYDTAAGAATYFASGNFSIGALPVITGAGICEFLGTTLTLAQSVPPNLLLAGGNVLLGSGFQNFGAITNLTISGATLPGTNSITGTMDWAAGVISGPMTVKSGGLLNINGNVALENVLTNAGTVTMTGAGAITVYNDGGPYFGGIYNLAGALWDIQTNANMGAVYGHEFFDNAGNFRRSLGTSTAIVGINFTNSGTVTGMANTLEFNNSFTTAGGTLAFGVSGPLASVPIYITGAVALSGTASVTWLDGFVPAVNNSFNLVQYGSHSGTFSTIDLPSGTAAAGQYGATVFSLLVTGVGPATNQPALNIERLSDSSVVILWPASATNFTLQITSNLSSKWLNVPSGFPTVGTNFVLTNSVSGSNAFFRLKAP